jgi:hypothetical protein
LHPELSIQENKNNSNITINIMIFASSLNISHKLSKYIS